MKAQDDSMFVESLILAGATGSFGCYDDEESVDEHEDESPVKSDYLSQDYQIDEKPQEGMGLKIALGRDLNVSLD